MAARRLVLALAACAGVCVLGGTPFPVSAQAPTRAAGHPRLLFDAAGLDRIRANAVAPGLAPVAERLRARANALLGARPLRVSTTGRGEPDPPGFLKGLAAARRLQGRTVTLAMAFLLSGDRRFRDAAVGELDRAITDWPIWVDTAHQPPYDLMSGELSLTFGLVYDWLHDALTPEERQRLREGVERRALRGYLDAVTRQTPPFWFTAPHNWNPVCNGGAAVLALSLGDDSRLARQVLDLAAPAMARYWDHLGADGGWDEGTGYWTYGHRYAFMAADALRRAGRPEGADYLARPGARTTGNFPLVFNPGRVLTASFGDSPSRVADPLLYFLAREYRNPAFTWFEDRATPRSLNDEGWPDEALTLAWRAPGERSDAAPVIPAVTAFASIGWAMLAPVQPDPPFFLALKNGSLAANHSHLDLNHVSVAVGDTMLLVDLGSRPYPADYFNRDRRYTYYEISTAGHNTVLVGGKGQAVGRAGVLLGPFEGRNYVAVVGVADNAYETRTPLARRTTVFVDKRYYVLLDEVHAESRVPIELRFHSYGTIRQGQSGGWTVTDTTAAADIVPADRQFVSGSIETPAGWIRPVRVLRLTTLEDTTTLALATAIVPRSPGATAPPAVSQRADGNALVVTVGPDRLVFRRGSAGYAVEAVMVGERK